MDHYYQKSVEDTLNSLGVSGQGLTDAETTRRRLAQGFNELLETNKKGFGEVFLEQFKDVLVLILIGAAGLSLLLGKWESSLVIIMVVLLNAMLGTIQYIKTEQSLQSLKALSSPKAKVMRNGEKVEIASRELLAGDLMFLDAGDYVSADGRIVECFSLQVNESSLTGESESVLKTNQVIEGDHVSVGDRKNMVFSGSFVTYGRAVVVVTAIGMATEIGLIANLLGSAERKKTPLQASLDEFGKKLAVVIMLIAAVILGLNTFVRGHDFIESLMFAVSLAVAAIPEALSAIVTIVLAIGTQKMAKEKAIIRNLHAVESLGSITVICSDKTGTLTQNKMSVQKVFVDETIRSFDELELGRPLEKKLVLMAMLCNDAVTMQDKEIGDPTEVALVSLGENYGLDELDVREEYPRVGEAPFDSERKLMSTAHEFKAQSLMITKGAPDVLLSKIASIASSSGARPLSEAALARIRAAIYEFSSNGLRVLAVGYKEIGEGQVITAADEADLTFLGLIAMMDPPREETVGAVTECVRAGVKPVMITGDHKVTAMAIARQVGILQENEEALEGFELDRMSEAELKERVEHAAVYARVSPEHKIRIVKAWQSRGNVVAMTGDGVNDAPALKQADIGIAMGITGTEVAKDSAAMVLADDNFSTIVKAIANGRAIYANIKNSIRFLLSGNTAGILSVLYASVAALPVPFAPVHLLFINLLTDSLPAIAIGLEAHNERIMDEKPRQAQASMINKPFAVNIFGEGLLIAICTMAAFYIGLADGNAAVASTMAFATLCLARLFHGFNCRGKESIIALGVFRNPYVWLAAACGCLLLEIVVRYEPLARAFEIAALTPSQHVIIYALAIVPLVVIQSYRLLFRRSE